MSNRKVAKLGSVKTGANVCSKVSNELASSILGGFGAKGFESLKIQITLERAALFVPISVSKSAKLELRKAKRIKGRQSMLNA